MNRAQFLRTLAAGVGGLLVGEEALEAFERLTHRRKYFPGWSAPKSPDVWGDWVFEVSPAQAREYLEAQRRGTTYTFEEVQKAIGFVNHRWLNVHIKAVKMPINRSPVVIFTAA